MNRSGSATTKSLSGAFLHRSAPEVARDLLGAILVSTIDGVRTSGRIVETEAYLGPDDPASHAATRSGRTVRNSPMFGPGGTTYVYLIYGMHWCFNVVTGDTDDPQAVLIRALEPLEGQGNMARRRSRSRNLTDGPGRLCQALGITGELNGHLLSRPPLRLLPGIEVPDSAVGTSGRIGIREARDWPLRYYVAHHQSVSVARPPTSNGDAIPR